MRSDRVKLFIVCILIFLTTSAGLAIFRNFRANSDLFNQINIASFLCGVFITLYLKIRKNLNYENTLLMFLVSLMFFIAHQMVLLNIDRSRSYYVIGWVHAGNVGVKNNLYTYDDVISSEKKNVEASNMRIREQIDRGVMIKMEDSLKLTFTGAAMYQTAEILSNVFSLENWKRNYR